ncbi:formate dehydrogenase accessory protein FdhE [Ramlibacter sp. AW1]|uniref:Formate dehydrogenase accessory protein FdhE n=1 Tax=Ramlibacter aurantiacus TaxID=2801330 RepID=A0A936ZI23_9BURK|nr:formate dehydrogenase accessory protein FdhE [Ramlibacter aurantiacus]MBL0420613.1 formate dehydrogenase accessory protein FdhE [Ramlibacter aurantiacus]
MSAAQRLDALAQAHPEWSGWLRVVRELAPGLSDPAWDADPPHAGRPSDAAPMLAGATLQPDGRALARLLDRLAGVAQAQGLQALAGTARPGRTTSPDEALAVFLAALDDDPQELGRWASRTGATPEGARALAQLLPMPYLHGCARAWSSTARGAAWSHGHCPVCGAWPAFAEVRGIERTRHLRCGRCGAGWPMPALACTYCGMRDHERLGTLSVDDKAARFALEVCHACMGYLKSCTTLQPTPSDEVIVTDLASVEFDIAAVERGFLRPPGHGASLRASLGTAAKAPAPAPARRGWS